MLPDDRLRELLQRAEDQTRSDPQFIDGLFDDLLTRRRRRVVRFGRWELPRPVAYGALVPLVVVVAVAGFLGVTSPRSPSTGVGAVSASPTVSSPPSPIASPTGSGDQGPIALIDAESGTFRYVAPNGWDTFDASSPELAGVVNDLRVGQVDPGNDWTAADITASAIEFLADNGEGVVGEGAVAIDPSSNGVDGALVISVGEFGSMTPAFAGTQLSQNMGAATAAGDVTEPTTREIGLGEATSVAGTYPSGHVMHRAYVPVGDNQVVEVILLTKVGQEDSSPVFEAILNSIERKGVSPSP